MKEGTGNAKRIRGTWREIEVDEREEASELGVNVWLGPRAVNPETVLQGGPGDNAQSFRNGN